jgi:hypothetical protein
LLSLKAVQGTHNKEGCTSGGMSCSKFELRKSADYVSALDRCSSVGVYVDSTKGTRLTFGEMVCSDLVSLYMEDTSRGAVFQVECNFKCMERFGDGLYSRHLSGYENSLYGGHAIACPGASFIRRYYYIGEQSLDAGKFAVNADSSIISSFTANLEKKNISGVDELDVDKEGEVGVLLGVGGPPYLMPRLKGIVDNKEAGKALANLIKVITCQAELERDVDRARNNLMGQIV